MTNYSQNFEFRKTFSAVFYYVWAFISFLIYDTIAGLVIFSESQNLINNLLAPEIIYFIASIILPVFFIIYIRIVGNLNIPFNWIHGIFKFLRTFITSISNLSNRIDKWLYIGLYTLISIVILYLMFSSFPLSLFSVLILLWLVYGVSIVVPRLLSTSSILDVIVSYFLVLKKVDHNNITMQIDQTQINHEINSPKIPITQKLNPIDFLRRWRAQWDRIINLYEIKVKGWTTLSLVITLSSMLLINSIFNPSTTENIVIFLLMYFSFGFPAVIALDFIKKLGSTIYYTTEDSNNNQLFDEDSISNLSSIFGETSVKNAGIVLFLLIFTNLLSFVTRLEHLIGMLIVTVFLYVILIALFSGLNSLIVISLTEKIDLNIDRAHNLLLNHSTLKFELHVNDP